MLAWVKSLIGQQLYDWAGETDGFFKFSTFFCWFAGVCESNKCFFFGLITFHTENQLSFFVIGMLTSMYLKWLWTMFAVVKIELYNDNILLSIRVLLRMHLNVSQKTHSKMRWQSFSNVIRNNIEPRICIILSHRCKMKAPLNEWLQMVGFPFTNRNNQWIIVRFSSSNISPIVWCWAATIALLNSLTAFVYPEWNWTNENGSTWLEYIQ